MNALKNQRIIANAGSGKTYRLVSRYLELLKHEVPAERIIALTFTRKAAGEFLDKIFQRLTEGTTAGDAASGLTAAECSLHLRQLVDKMPRLALGTLDSFFGRMVRAFPFECGLAGEITLMDGHALNLARREALEAVFRDHSDDESFAAFLDLIRQQNRNSEGRNVTEALGREIDALHEGFLMTPPGRSWGSPDTIWPAGCTLLQAEEPGGLAASFETVVFETHPDMPEEYRVHWTALLDDLRVLRAGASVSERAIKFALKALAPPSNKKDPDGFYLTVYRTKQFAFSARVRGLVEALGRAILRVELEGRLARSRALYDLVARFEGPYHQLIRGAGRLTFTDITGLLAAAEGAVWGGGTVRPLDRQQMDFRLDATYDHWLLDEFQDTSRLQWQALRNLVDEVVQSDTGRRSFFYVGDTKQAIYTWRGGDPWLFEEVAEFYNASGTGRIDTSEALAISRRSVPEILETVNTLFEPAHLGRLQDGFGFPEKTLDRWQKAWRDHEPHEKETNRGCVLWRTLEVGEEGRRATLDRAAARLIADIDPLSRGLTCAVLVQTNAHAVSVLEALRDEGLEARSEGRFNPCTDNDLGAAVVSLLRAISHPADALSRQHVAMTPLAALTEGGFDAFRVRALQAIREKGFSGALGDWLRTLPLADNTFAAGRAADLLAAAADFDASHCGGTIDDLTLTLQNRVSMEDPASGAIRVLTVHASKGLDFDMVVLPLADDGAIASLREDSPVYLHRPEGGTIQWGLDLPTQAVCEADPVLRAASQDALAEDTYENLCVHYVATTRAKRGLYFLSEKLKPDSKARGFNRLLHASLTQTGGDYLVGNPTWYETTTPKTAADELPEMIPLVGRPVQEPRPESPSARPGHPHPTAARLLAGSGGFSVGTQVHELLAGVEWLDSPPPEFPAESGEAAKLVRNFLQSDTGRRVFTRPAEPHTLWREQAFDVWVDTRWVSGIFDRVVIYADRAEIFDFKTDAHLDAGAHHDQMELYRTSLAGLTGLAPGRIQPRLIAVRSGQEIVLP